MTKRPRNIHWGDWIIERSRVVGFRNQRELAESIGCRPEQLSRWAQMEKPPGQMRKGFDKKLAQILDVTPEVLFRKYAKLLPSQAGFIAELPGDAEPWKETGWSDLEDDKKLAILTYFLVAEDVQRLIDFGVSLIEARKIRELREWTWKDGQLHRDPTAE